MVAHFHPEAALCVRDTFPTYRDGRLFGRHGVEIWRARGKLSRRTFISLLVEWSSTTDKISGGQTRVWALGRLHANISWTERTWSANRWTSHLRRRLESFCLQRNNKDGIFKRFTYVPLRWLRSCTSLELLLWPTWLTLVLSPSESCLKGGTNRVDAELWWEVSLVRVHGFKFALGGCKLLLEVGLLTVKVCPSLWALLSSAFRLFSSIFLCCSAVNWLDMMNGYSLTLTTYSVPAMEQIIHLESFLQW